MIINSDCFPGAALGSKPGNGSTPSTLVILCLFGRILAERILLWVRCSRHARWLITQPGTRPLPVRIGNGPSSLVGADDCPVCRRTMSRIRSGCQATEKATRTCRPNARLVPAMPTFQVLFFLSFLHLPFLSSTDESVTAREAYVPSSPQWHTSSF